MFQSRTKTLQQCSEKKQVFAFPLGPTLDFQAKSFFFAQSFHEPADVWTSDSGFDKICIEWLLICY